MQVVNICRYVEIRMTMLQTGKKEGVEEPHALAPNGSLWRPRTRAEPFAWCPENGRMRTKARGFPGLLLGGLYWAPVSCSVLGTPWGRARVPHFPGTQEGGGREKNHQDPSIRWAKDLTAGNRWPEPHWDSKLLGSEAASHTTPACPRPQRLYQNASLNKIPYVNSGKGFHTLPEVDGVSSFHNRRYALGFRIHGRKFIPFIHVQYIPAYLSVVRTKHHRRGLIPESGAEFPLLQHKSAPSYNPGILV